MKNIQLSGQTYSVHTSRYARRPSFLRIRQELRDVPSVHIIIPNDAEPILKHRPSKTQPPNHPTIPQDSHKRFRPRPIGLSWRKLDFPPEEEALCDVNDEIFERDCSGLEKEEVEGTIYDPFLEHGVSRLMDET